MADRVVATAQATWAFAAPHLQTAGRVVHRTLGWIAHFLLRHRLAVFRTTHRAMWWGALAVMFVVGRALLAGTEVGPVVDDAPAYFAAGLGLCLIVLIFAAERRMRLAAFMLGAGHGAFGLVTWLISQA